MLKECRQEERTIAQTGICLFNQDPASCSHRVDGEINTESSESENISDAPLEVHVQMSGFPSSRTHTLTEVRDLAGKRYMRIVGILGIPDAGKTALLVSLYLLVSRAQLSGFTFAGSQTLMGFEQISRGARRWNHSNPPDQLTSHTQLPNDRDAGFLHMQLESSHCGSMFDLLFSDLPGEWTTELMEKNRTDRFEFLKSADVVWLVVDGEAFFGTDRQHILHRMKLLVRRIEQFLIPAPKIILVITRKDKCCPDNETIEEMCSEAVSRGLSMEPILVAPFSDDETTVSPGTGIAELLSLSTKQSERSPDFWPDIESPIASTRSILSFPK